MFDRPTSWFSPKLKGVADDSKGGYALIACDPIKAGELMVVWGGEIVDSETLEQLSEAYQRRSIQVEEDLYIVPMHIGPADYVNHCCNPNAGMSGQIALVAMRDIAPGEEICYDYAMSDGSPYDEFECRCNAETCRKRITGEDWRSPDLWERYAGHFSPYLQRRIDRLKAGHGT